MPRDAIISIKNAEAEARSIEAEAVRQAQEMTEETERSCIQFCKKEREELSAELAVQLDGLRKKSEVLLEKNARANKELAEEISRKSEDRMRGAVNIILREIDKQCQGN